MSIEVIVDRYNNSRAILYDTVREEPFFRGFLEDDEGVGPETQAEAFIEWCNENGVALRSTVSNDTIDEWYQSYRADERNLRELAEEAADL